MRTEYPVRVNLFSTGFVNPVFMSVIRPDLPSFTQVAPTPRDAAVREAQAAFFRAALGATDAPLAQNPPVRGQTASPPSSASSMATSSGAPVGSSQRTPATAAPPASSSQPDPTGETERYLRPGSYIDIRI